MSSEQPRIASLLRMIERNPADPRPHFGLAAEYEKLERWQDAAAELRTYLSLADDQGNAWGRLGRALQQLGDRDGARDAFSRGIAAARRHGHPSMAEEFENLHDNV
jgi:tetratricopeptide (TPR) repeat protein